MYYYGFFGFTSSGPIINHMGQGLAPDESWRLEVCKDDTHFEAAVMIGLLVCERRFMTVMSDDQTQFVDVEIHRTTATELSG